MAGKIKMMINSIIQQKSKGNPTIMTTTKTKLIMKGIDVDRYTSSSGDDPKIMEKLFAIARDLNVNLERGR